MSIKISTDNNGYHLDACTADKTDWYLFTVQPVISVAPQTWTIIKTQSALLINWDNTIPLLKLKYSNGDKKDSCEAFGRSQVTSIMFNEDDSASIEYQAYRRMNIGNP